MPATGAAIRAFSDAVNDPQTVLSRHPGDYVLYQVGEFNDSDGTLKTVAPAVHLGIGTDYVERKPQVLTPDMLKAVAAEGANHGS